MVTTYDRAGRVVSTVAALTWLGRTGRQPLLLRFRRPGFDDVHRCHRPTPATSMTSVAASGDVDSAGRWEHLCLRPGRPTHLHIPRRASAPNVALKALGDPAFTYDEDAEGHAVLASPGGRGSSAMPQTA